MECHPVFIVSLQYLNNSIFCVIGFLFLKIYLIGFLILVFHPPLCFFSNIGNTFFLNIIYTYRIKMCEKHLVWKRKSIGQLRITNREEGPRCLNREKSHSPEPQKNTRITKEGPCFQGDWWANISLEKWQEQKTVQRLQKPLQSCISSCSFCTGSLARRMPSCQENVRRKHPGPSASTTDQQP